MTLVSVSREEGSWGGDVARDLASRLGYRLLDLKALLAEAEAYGGLRASSPELIERQPGLLERLDQERRRYGVLLRAVVYNVALQDNVVFLGRGIGHLLGDISHALKVLVICPPGVRVERIMQRGAGGRPGPLSREQAEEIVRRTDRDRGSYIRYMFQVDWMDPLNYTVAMNTGTVPVPAAIETLAQMIASGAYDATEVSRARLQALADSSKRDAERVAGARR
jgi:cytidylate kinase